MRTVKAVIFDINPSSDQANVEVIVGWIDENDDTVSPNSVFQLGWAEMEAGNLTLLIQRRAADIQVELENKSKVDQFKADLLGKYFDVSDPTKDPIDVTPDREDVAPA